MNPNTLTNFFTKIDSKALLRIIAKMLVYGALINYAFTFILNMPLNFFTVIAYGIVWHFVSDEIPFIVNNYRLKK